MTNQLPTLTPEQRAENLRKAAAARHARAEVKAKLKSGELDPIKVLSSDDPAISKMCVCEFLVSLPKVGMARARRIMRECGMDPDSPRKRRLKGLGLKQSAAIMRAVSEL